MSQSPLPLKPGTIVSVALPGRIPQGKELEGLHPAVVINVISARMDLAWVVPLTTDRGYPWISKHPNLYMRIPEGVAGVPSNSVMLIDQFQAVDITRLKRAFGSLPPKLLTAVKKSLAEQLGFQIGKA